MTDDKPALTIDGGAYMCICAICGDRFQDDSERAVTCPKCKLALTEQATIDALNRAAKEIRRAGHNGWGNACADGAALIASLQAGGSCTFAAPGRGDCEHFIGLPGKSIPGQHSGPDDTVDYYGKPNGWCWHCWRAYQIDSLREQVGKAYKTISTMQCEIDKAYECIGAVGDVVLVSGNWRPSDQIAHNGIVAAVVQMDRELTSLRRDYDSAVSGREHYKRCDEYKAELICDLNDKVSSLRAENARLRIRTQELSGDVAKALNKERIADLEAAAESDRLMALQDADRALERDKAQGKRIAELEGENARLRKKLPDVEQIFDVVKFPDDHPTFVAQQERIAELEADIAEWKRREAAQREDANARNEAWQNAEDHRCTLEAALRKYGWHTAGCQKNPWAGGAAMAEIPLNAKCTCGLDAALGGGDE